MKSLKWLIGMALVAGGALNLTGAPCGAQCSKPEKSSKLEQPAPEKGATGLMENQYRATSTTSGKSYKYDRGTIQSVDAKDSRFTITDSRNAEVNVCWDANTRFLEHNKAITASDLRPGERVKIAGQKQGDLFRATEIRVYPQHAATTTRQYSAREATPPPQGYDW